MIYGKSQYKVALTVSFSVAEQGVNLSIFHDFSVYIRNQSVLKHMGKKEQKVNNFANRQCTALFMENL
jgi:hypothetical protein